MSNNDILDQVKLFLTRGKENSSAEIKNLGYGCTAFVTKTNSMTGVFIPCALNDKLHEKFASVELQYLPKIIIQNTAFSGLYLYMHDKDTNTRLLNEFATICTNFIDPGENGTNRQSIIEKPLDWWRSWKQIIGNRSSEKMVHALIGEMMVYHYLLQQGKQYNWTGADRKRIDFEGKDDSIEVKSTINRNGEEISVHGVFQMMLCDDVPLCIIFCRLEENPHGKSINNMIDILVDDGCNRNDIEEAVTGCGFFEGMSDRNIHFILLEARKYAVNSEFPCITPAMFVGGGIPSGVSNLQYTVDLANLKYEILDIN